MNNIDSKGKLFIVPTPIGNLEDITLRALKILSDVDIIACEDTRTTSHLLKHFKIENKKLISCYSHNEESRISQLISLINDGKSIALVSDAGTPGISDPGVRFVSAAINENIVIVPLPGAVALTCALTASGFPTDEFVFVGFVPHKKGRQTLFKYISEEKRTIVMYDSPHRILKTLSEIIEHTSGDRRGAICREITKIYEEFNRGTLKDLFEIYANRDSIKGEFVLIIEGKK